MAPSCRKLINLTNKDIFPMLLCLDNYLITYCSRAAQFIAYIHIDKTVLTLSSLNNNLNKKHTTYYREDKSYICKIIKNFGKISDLSSLNYGT